MAEKVKNSSYMVSDSHIALRSNLSCLVLQAKTHNHCSNNLYTTVKDKKKKNQKLLSVTVVILGEDLNVFILLHYLYFKESDNRLSLEKPILIARRFKELFCFKLHIQIIISTIKRNKDASF